MATMTPDVQIRKLDDKNWIVERRHVADPNGRGGHFVKKPGKARWVVQGYHGTIVCAVRSALDLDLGLSDDEFDLADLIRHIDDGVERIVAAVERGSVDQPDDEAEPVSADVDVDAGDQSDPVPWELLNSRKMAG